MIPGAPKSQRRKLNQLESLGQEGNWSKYERYDDKRRGPPLPVISGADSDSQTRIRMRPEKGAMAVLSEYRPHTRTKTSGNLHWSNFRDKMPPCVHEVFTHPNGTKITEKVMCFFGLWIYDKNHHRRFKEGKGNVTAAFYEGLLPQRAHRRSGMSPVL